MARGSRGRDQGTGRGLRSALASVALLAALVGLAACSDYKKLSHGGSVTDVLMHDILGQDRPAGEYYQYVRDSHKSCDFCYACGDDAYVVDKNIDAVQRLGDAQFGRLEGEAQVLELFTEVLLEDCSALARSSAANSITKIGIKLPEYRYTPVPDDGSKLLSAMQELDRMYSPDGRLLACGPGAIRRILTLVTLIGNLEFEQYLNTRNAIKLFYDRKYLVDATDPTLRAAIDTALVKRMRALIFEALESAVDDREATVRIDALKGLKTLTARRAVDAVEDRLRVESQWLVKIEAIEYFGKIGTRQGVVALIGLLDDPNASVRHKARQGLVRIAGKDYGARSATWKYWAREKDPSVDFGDDPEDGDGGPGDGSPFGP